MSSAAETAALLARDAVDDLPRGELERKLALGRPLRIKLGIDPTAPDIHIGHVVVLRKLREFQDAGHIVVLIIGNFTARVGDPTGRSELRPVLSEDEVSRNAASFERQAAKVLDTSPDRLEVRYNADWLDMPMASLLTLAGSVTAGQVLERDDFARRREAGAPISMLELLYPLLQGYDSVAVRADVELGGTDQKFNLLLARDVQRAYGQPEQAILTMPILVGTDGRRKMSKTYGNQIGVSDQPAEMYGRTMSIPDSATPEYFRLVLGHEPPESLEPRDAKRALARALIAQFHSPDDAEQAEQEFDRVFVERGAPERIEEATFDGSGPVHLPALLAELFDLTRSEARRLIQQGAVTVDGQTLGDLDVDASTLDGRVIRLGRRRFLRLHARERA